MLTSSLATTSGEGTNVCSEEWSRMSGHLLVTEGVTARVIGIFWCGKKYLNGLRHFESMTP